MSHAEAYLKEVFGVEPINERPAGIHGILHTTDYDNFTIVDDVGHSIHTFSGAKLANKCLPGDHVHWSEGECVLDLRGGHPPIVGTLALTSKTRYGLTARGIPIYLFVPYDKSYPNFVVGCSAKDLSRNLIGIVKLDDWKVNSTFPRGILQETLGPAGNYEAECQALIWQASPWKWPKGPYEIQTREKPVRHVLQGFTCNIDPEGCKDIDDVFTFEKVGDGLWKVAISISDVATYVENGSVEDILASVIGQTLYDPDGKVLRPMLPVEYSEKTCSLHPDKESYGISLCFVWNGHEITNLEWVESVVTNQRSFTYEAFQAWDSEYRTVLASIASYLAQGEPITDAHEWVEQMMIFYNKEAGRLLKEAKMGILRRHSMPDRERLAHYARAESVVPGLMTLAFSSAEYCLAEEDDTQHYGLDSAHYAHASSPIRRYADLVNQRVLKILLRGSKEQFIVPQAMVEMNKREKAIRRFARDMDFLRAIQEDKNTCQGVIVECIPVEETKCKVRIYIPRWKRVVSATYRKASEHSVWSRDEKQEIDVTEFRDVTVQYVFHTNLTHWKERIILSIT